jgi:hypothetical protein
MSHHFDTPTAREDPRINLCDFYLFRGTPGTVAMALTVNPDAGPAPPILFEKRVFTPFVLISTMTLERK